MAIFNRSVKKAAISPEPTKAEAAGGYGGANSVGRFTSMSKARQEIMRSACQLFRAHATLWQALLAAWVCVCTTKFGTATN